MCIRDRVPPTPGPLTAAGLMGVDIGYMIIVGAALSIPIFIAAIIYAKWIGKKIYQIPLDDGTYEKMEFKKEYIKTMEELDSIIDAKELPSLSHSISPILVPLVLIFCKTGLSLLSIDGGMLYNIISLLGDPIVALGIGTTLAVYGLGDKLPKKKLIGIMNESIKDTGIIMLITGAGGSLGNVVKVSGIGDALGTIIVGWPIPAILLPVIIGGLMRFALGSATVAITRCV